MGGKRCVVCAKRLGKGKVIRVGDDRYGPFCPTCAKSIASEMGMPVVEGGDMPDGAKILSIPDIPGLPESMRVFLWDLPEAEFPAWFEMLTAEEGEQPEGQPRFTYGEYRARLHGLADELAAKGNTVVYLTPTVNEMVAKCRDMNVPLSSTGRAKALFAMGANF